MGYFFNPGGGGAGYLLGSYEPGVQGLLQGLLQPGMVVYDVGASVGFLTLLAAVKVGPAGSVISFEPSAHNTEILRENLANNGVTNVRVVSCALGADDGVAEFAISDDPGWGKVLTRGEPPGEMVAKCQVILRRLDTIVKENKLPLPDLIKVDIEGGEVAFLKGAIDSITSSHPFLLIELHGTNKDVAEQLAGLDYDFHVLGSKQRVEDAPWYAYILGVHKSRPSQSSQAVSLLDRLNSAR